MKGAGAVLLEGELRLVYVADLVFAILIDGTHLA